MSKLCIIGLVDGKDLFFVDSSKNPQRRLQQLQTTASIEAPESVLRRISSARDKDKLSIVVLQKRTYPARLYTWVDFLEEQGLKLGNVRGTITEKALVLLKEQPLLGVSDLGRMLGTSKQNVQRIERLDPSLAEYRRKTKASLLKSALKNI